MNEHSVLITASHMTVGYPDGDIVTIYSSQEEHWDSALQCLRNKDYDGIRDLLTAPVRDFLSFENGRVSVRDGLVMLDDYTPVEKVLATRLLDMLKLGLDVEPMARFVENLYDNPSYRAVNELYGFLEASNLTITPDGCFLAYKRVRDDYMDIYTGKMDNSIGSHPWMNRNEVDDNKEETCSKGLHFCGRDYLGSYGTSSNGCRTMVVKVNPRDVVSIPVDYNNHKGRACEYDVVGELEHSKEAPLEGTVNYDYEDEYRDDDWLPEDEDGEDGVPTSFPTRTAARAFVANNPTYVVRDRGAGRPSRWYVEPRKVRR